MVAFTDDRLSGDIFDINYTSALFADANAGPDKTVTVLGLEIQGDDAGNYTANEIALATATIRQAGITVTANPQTKTYGDADPGLTYEASDLIGLDEWMGGLEREEGEDVSSYQINQGSLSAGNNYAITYVPADLVISRATLTVSATASNKEYDRNRLASVMFTDDRVSGDFLDINYTSALFADENVGEYKNVSVEGISISGDDALNYTLANTLASAQASITQKRSVCEPGGGGCLH